MGDITVINRMLAAKRPALMASAAGRSEDEVIRFQSEIMACIGASAKLQMCDADSLWRSVRVAWSMRLEPTLDHFYLVPFQGKATLILGFKGLLELARRHHAVRSIHHELVYEGEEFRADRSDPYSLHHPHRWGVDRSDDAKILGGYLVATLGTSDHPDKVLHICDRTLFDQRRDEAIRKARDKRTSPWTTNFAEMCLKTVVRDAINRGKLPMSIEMREALAIDERPAAQAAVVEQPDASEVVEIEAEVVESKQDLIDRLLSIAPCDEAGIMTLSSVEFGTTGKVLDDLDPSVLQGLIDYYGRANA
jgi:recombination protein RecT